MFIYTPGACPPLTLSLPKATLTKPRKLLHPELPTKPKSVTTPMKALTKYFLMVVLPFVLNRVYTFAHFMLNLNRETWQ